MFGFIVCMASQVRHVKVYLIHRQILYPNDAIASPCCQMENQIKTVWLVHRDRHRGEVGLPDSRLSTTHTHKKKRKKQQLTVFPFQVRMLSLTNLCCYFILRKLLLEGRKHALDELPERLFSWTRRVGVSTFSVRTFVPGTQHLDLPCPSRRP